ncbi:hypothetical protein BDZ90DRAFT_214563, partial [Jaminaea rosea]
GTASFIVWLFAQSPQILTNYQRGSVDGLSLVFLGQWMGGDVTNLLGCILTDQLTFQKLTAAWFCLVDVVLMAQYIGSSHHGNDDEQDDYFVRRHPHHGDTSRQSSRRNSRPSSRNSSRSNSRNTSAASSPRLGYTSSRQHSNSSAHRHLAHTLSTLLSGTSPAPPPDAPAPSLLLLGRLLSWLCTLLYLTSRLPQIYENHTRRSVAGLSILLFISAFVGNALYAISILTSPLMDAEDDGGDYFRECMPFLLGSAGTLVFDAVILGQ